MSSVRLVSAWRLPVLAPGAAPQRRRVLVVAVALVVLAAAGVLVMNPGDMLRRPGTTREAPAALAAARARAVARAGAAARARAATPAATPAMPKRVVDGTTAAALFASHSWYVPPPPPPPVVAGPPPPPSAPPFPYTFVGSYAPSGETPVYFLARGDRVVDAHVGDRLDGVYELRSGANGQLTFNYLPLNIEQALSIGASQ